MTETKELSDDELEMQELCKQVQIWGKQREKARLNHLLSKLAINDFGLMLARAKNRVAELERKGIKKVVVEEKPKNDQAGPQDPKIRA